MSDRPLAFARTALLLAVAVALVASPVTAQATDQPDWAESAYENSSSMVDSYNDAVSASDLGPAADQLKGEVVNLRVEGDDGSTATFSFEVTDDHRIEGLQQGTRDDATLKMTVEKDAYERITSAEDPSAAFKSALRSGDVGISGIGAVNGVKWGAINVAADVARGLGGLF